MTVDTEMKCHRCGSEKVCEQVTDLPFKLDVHQVLVVKNVPCHICDSCGEVLLADKVMSNIDHVIDHVRQSNTELEVVRFAA